MRVKEGNKEKDILEAAIKVFAEVGYHKAKISKIAEVANVATGSIYIYFHDKEDILLQIFDQIWSRLHDELVKVKANTMLTPIDQFDAIIDLLFDICIGNPALAVVLVNEQNHLQLNANDKFTPAFEEFLNIGVQIVKDGIDKGVFSEVVEVEILRYYLFGSIRSLLQRWATDPQNYPLTKIRHNVKFLTKRGILK